MLKLLVKLALVGAALAAVGCFVPFGGRTLRDRWRAAPNPGAFAERTFAEVRAAFEDRAPSKAKRAPARSQARAPQHPKDGRPSEAHTEADRRALDRIVAEHLAEGR